MILHLVINCDPCIDCQIHTYLIIACYISIKSDLNFYFMGICKDINTVFFCHCIFFKVDRKERNTVA